MPYHLLFETEKKFNDYFLEGEENSITHLPNINDINIIIGSNNSGKSRLIRKLMLIKSFNLINPLKFNEYSAFIAKKGPKALKSGVILYDAILENDINQKISVNKGKLFESFFKELRTEGVILDELTKNIVEEKLNKAYYIPTLRTAHTIYENEDSKVEKDLYTETIQRNYKLNRNGLEIFTGQKLYKNILNSRNSKKEIRKRFEEFEKFLSKNFFDGKKLMWLLNLIKTII